MELALVDGWTADVDFAIKNGDGTAFDLTTASVALIFTDKNGNTIDTSGDASIPAPATGGIVRWSPDAQDVSKLRGPNCSMHVKITISGKDTYVPQGQALAITVYPQ